MTEPVYRVKPLVWSEPGSWGICSAPVVFGNIVIATYNAGNGFWARVDAVTNGDPHDADGGLEGAKRACEADYRERVLRCLVEVVTEPKVSDTDQKGEWDDIDW